VSGDNKVAVITGASRGIGLGIAGKLAKQGYRVALLAKTTRPHPKLPGTLQEAVSEIESLGGTALGIKTDIREEEQVVEAHRQILGQWGRVDVLVNNASAISLTPTLETAMKRFDLMHQVNARATFMCSKIFLPELLKQGGHILTLSPPLTWNVEWFAPHFAYTSSKFGMSLCSWSLAAEMKGQALSINTLWPKTTIATAAVANLLGGEAMVKRSRKPAIVADAAWEILKKAPGLETGQFLVDEDVLRDAGGYDLSSYAVDPAADLAPDFFL
jgi:citronellol/citronellal dehydrogenase